jgi:hypothetical protein
MHSKDAAASFIDYGTPHTCCRVQLLGLANMRWLVHPMQCHNMQRNWACAATSRQCCNPDGSIGKPTSTHLSIDSTGRLCNHQAPCSNHLCQSAATCLISVAATHNFCHNQLSRLRSSILATFKPNSQTIPESGCRTRHCWLYSQPWCQLDISS